MAGESGEGKGEPAKKGRPTNAERLGRERANSVTGSMEFLWGVKRKDREDGNGETAEALKKSAKTVGSPAKGEGEVMMAVLLDLREEVRGMREEMRVTREELKDARGERMVVKRMIEDMNRRAEEDREELGGRMDELEKKVDRMVVTEKKWEGMERKMERLEKGGGEGAGGGWNEKVERLEWAVEMQERERRRSNIIVRGLKVVGEGKQGIREGLEKVMEEIGVNVEVKDVRSLARRDNDEREMVWAKLGSEEQKRKVMQEKRRLGERKERIGDDYTEKERRAEWMINRVAEKERGEGKRVRVGYMKLWVEGKCKIWDEREGGFRKGMNGGREMKEATEGTGVKK